MEYKISAASGKEIRSKVVKLEPTQSFDEYTPTYVGYIPSMKVLQDFINEQGSSVIVRNNNEIVIYDDWVE